MKDSNQMTATHWYSVTFSQGTSQRSYILPAACTGNAIAVGWCRLEDTQGTREGWSLAMVSATSCGGDQCCGCEVCTPDADDLPPSHSVEGK